MQKMILSFSYCKPIQFMDINRTGDQHLTEMNLKPVVTEFILLSMCYPFIRFCWLEIMSSAKANYPGGGRNVESL